MRTCISALILGIVALAPAACGGGRVDSVRAREVFESEGCAVCHGTAGAGQEGTGPALRELAPYWTEARVIDYLKDPPGFRQRNPDFEQRREVTYELEMPAFDHLSEDDLRELARWLMTL